MCQVCHLLIPNQGNGNYFQNIDWELLLTYYADYTNNGFVNYYEGKSKEGLYGWGKVRTVKTSTTNLRPHKYSKGSVFLVPSTGNL